MCCLPEVKKCHELRGNLNEILSNPKEAGVLGRFISRDPIGHAGGLNLYAYPTNPVSYVDPSGLLYVSGSDSAIQSFLYNLEVLSGFQLALGGKNGDQVVFQRRTGKLGVSPFATSETAAVIKSLLESDGWIKAANDDINVAWGICLEDNAAANSSSQFHTIDMADIAKTAQTDYVHAMGTFLHEVAEANHEFTVNGKYKPSHAYANRVEGRFLNSFGAGGVLSEGNNTVTFKDGFQLLFKNAPPGSIVKTHGNGCKPRTGWR